MINWTQKRKSSFYSQCESLILVSSHTYLYCFSKFARYTFREISCFWFCWIPSVYWKKYSLTFFYLTGKLQQRYKTETISYIYKLCFFENISRPRPYSNSFKYEEKAVLHNTDTFVKFNKWLNSLLPEFTFMYEEKLKSGRFNQKLWSPWVKSSI